MSFFSSFRELRRLAKSKKYWRGKADEREKEIQRLNDLLFTQNITLTDRILTTKVGAFAVGDEIRAKAQAAPEESLEEQWEQFVALKKLEIDEELITARQYDPSVTQTVEEVFAVRETEYRQEFTAQHVNVRRF